MSGVSIVVPVYHVAPYIESCLKSVMGQNYAGDMECLLVDDCGSDDSMAIAERMIGAYTGPIRFQILHHEHNRGLSAARNTGTDAATGDYVLYLDSDDELTQDCIKRLMRPVEEDATVEMVVGNYASFSSQEKRTTRHQRERDVNTQKAVRDLFFCQRGFYVNAWNKLVKKELLDGHQIGFKEGVLWEDNLWTFFLLKHLSHVCLIPDVTYLHYKRPQSITLGTDRERKTQHWKNIYKEIAQNFTAGEAGKEARYFIRYVVFQMTRNQKSEELHEIAKPYLKALYDDHDYLAWLFYSGIVTVSRCKWGRKLLYDVVRWLM